MTNELVGGLISNVSEGGFFFGGGGVIKLFHYNPFEAFRWNALTKMLLLP